MYVCMFIYEEILLENVSIFLFFHDISICTMLELLSSRMIVNVAIEQHVDNRFESKTEAKILIDQTGVDYSFTPCL
jgi:hypothetical protein